MHSVVKSLRLWKEGVMFDIWKKHDKTFVDDIKKGDWVIYDFAGLGLYEVLHITRKHFVCREENYEYKTVIPKNDPKLKDVLNKSEIVEGGGDE